MRTPGFQSFRRTLTLFLLLVVLPSAGLSAFGVLAIVNEQAAVEKRIRNLWTARLIEVEARFTNALQNLQAVTTADGLFLNYNGVNLDGRRFAIRDRRVISSAPLLETTLTPLLARLEALPNDLTISSASSAEGSLLFATLRRGAVLFGAVISPQALHELLQASKSTKEAEGADVSVEPMQQASGHSVLSRLVSGVTEVREAALGSRPLAQRPLPRPLDEFQLVANALGSDPVAYASQRNRIVYTSLLALLFAALVVGVVLTARALYRETRLSSLKTDFVSLMSHEFRTPLTSIRMFIEMLATEQVKDPAEHKIILDLLMKETIRLSQFGESVLEWSRIERGRKSYNIVPVETAELIEAAAGPFRTQRRGEPMDFSVHIAEGLPMVPADKAAIGSALLNLLHNAFKYSSSEGRKIRLTANRLKDDLVIDVEDNGRGIPKNEQKKIFDHFYRGDDLLSRNTEGTGLGLAIAQRIVIDHGGRITVDSAVNAGSRFRMYLPLE